MKCYSSGVVTIFLLFLTITGFAKGPIKILAIGNSFSRDAVEQYLYELAEAAGDSLVIGNAYIGGCSLERHNKNLDENAPAYVYRKIIGGKYTEEPSKTLEECIMDEPWDFISIQQVSQHSGMYETYFPYSTNLIEYINSKTKNPDVKIVLHRTWAYSKDSSHDGFTNYDRNQDKMYKAIVETTNKVVANVSEVDFIIPAGTAIQNGRTSPLGDSFCRDGYHLELTYGRYTAACTWYEAIVGKSVVGNSYHPSSISPAVAKIAQKAAHAAVRKPDKIKSLAKCKL